MHIPHIGVLPTLTGNPPQINTTYYRFRRNYHGRKKRTIFSLMRIVVIVIGAVTIHQDQHSSILKGIPPPIYNS